MSIVHLTTHIPVRSSPHVNLDMVRAPTDLPPYLFMGRLDESSFVSGTTGWSATWRRSKDTWFHLEYDAKANTLTGNDAWLGVDGKIAVRAGKPNLTSFTQQYFGSPATPWDEKAEKELQTRWNIKYQKKDNSMPIIAGLPDGVMKTLLLPIPINALSQLVETFIAFRDDPDMDFPVSGYVRAILGAVNYVEGRNPNWSQNPNELFLMTLKATGFPPISMPVREEGNDGSAAWTVRRIVCMAFIGVPFAGLIPLLEKLEKADLLSAGPIKSCDVDPGFDSAEFSGCVVPSGHEIRASSMAWETPDGNRRIFWQMPPDLMETFQDQATHRDDDPEIARSAAAALVAISKASLQGYQQYIHSG